MAITPQKLDLLPKEPGVYLMKNRRGTILYVGKAKSLRTRVKQYFLPGRDEREMVPFLTSQVSHIDTIVTFSEKEALLLENTLIKKHQPKYNAMLKDDKTFIMLVINHKHKWPMIRIARFKGKPPKDALHYGPFTSALAARETLETMSRIFPLRECSDRELASRKRPCLLYSIKRCLAPCVGKCTQEEYGATLKQAIAFLKGQDKEVLKELEKSRDSAAEALEFEKAGALQKKIEQIEHVLSNTRAIVHSGMKECDAFALFRVHHDIVVVQLIFRDGRLIGAEYELFIKVAPSDEEALESFIVQTYKRAGPPPPEVLLPFPMENEELLSEVLKEEHGKSVKVFAPQKGEKHALVRLAEKNAKALFYQEHGEQSINEALLLDLEETLSLTRCPVRIVCFDTSNIAGSDLVASMVTFTDGAKDTKGYRLFTIKGISGPDDYGALREVLTRHFTKAKASDDLPDLAIIDGGKGQLNVAVEVFEALGIAHVDVLALTKESARHDKGLTKERIFLPGKKEAISLSPTSAALHFLQRIRDEAHRFAITFHKKKRSKRVIKSALEAISGIGPKKRTALLKHFGSVKRIKEASREELEQVKELSSADIEAICKWLTCDKLGN